MYHGQYPLPGYPRRLADLGLPTAVDAALTYNADKTFFIKKNLVWRFDEKRQSVDPGYPKKVRKIFRGLPKKMHSAFRHSGGQMYFLSGKKYYQVNRRIRRIDKSSPRLFTVDFMGCDSVKNWPHSDIYRSFVSNIGETDTCILIVVINLCLYSTRNFKVRIAAMHRYYISPHTAVVGKCPWLSFFCRRHGVRLQNNELVRMIIMYSHRASGPCSLVL